MYGKSYVVQIQISLLMLDVYLELVTLSADAAGQARLLDQLLHLLQQRGLSHHLTLLIGLKGK